jgi:ABC-type multidrug transport system ATPase subunit
MELSSGQRTLVGIVKAVLPRPSLLVLDEPTASLDPEATWEFRSLVEGLRQDGKTILLCSHLLAEVERVADRVLILTGGRRVALESLADLRARQASSARLEIEARNTEAAGAALARRGIAFAPWGERRVAIEGANGRGVAALEALREAGVEIRTFELTRPTLEEIFLAAVRKERDARGGATEPKA